MRTSRRRTSRCGLSFGAFDRVAVLGLIAAWAGRRRRGATVSTGRSSTTRSASTWRLRSSIRLRSRTSRPTEKSAVPARASGSTKVASVMTTRGPGTKRSAVRAVDLSTRPVCSLMRAATRSRTQSAETSRLTTISASTATPTTAPPTISSSLARLRLAGVGLGVSARRLRRRRLVLRVRRWRLVRVIVCMGPGGSGSRLYPEK